MAFRNVLLAYALIPLSLYGQERIETDRPNETETPFTVPKKYVQVELGFHKENKGNDDWTVLHPTSLLKYGISEKIEFRILASPVTEHMRLIPQNETFFRPVLVGSKLALLDEKGAIPKTALITQVSLPFLAGTKGKTPHAAPSFRFAMQNSLSKVVSLGYNVGVEWNGESSTPSWVYTLAPGIDLGKKWYCYLESYGFITRGDLPDNYLDAGVLYFMTNDLQLDLSGGVGLSTKSLSNYGAIGVSFRLNAAD